MSPSHLQRLSIKTRVTLFTLVIFLASLWSLAYLASRMLRADLEQVFGQQQFATVSLVAAQVNHDFEIRSKALEKMAATSAAALQAGSAAMQTLLEQNVTLADLFNFGVLAYGADGTAIADVPRNTGRIGVNYLDNPTVIAALREGKSTLSEVHLGKVLRAPVFGMTVPIRDTHGQVIGALSGVIDLGKPSFLDNVFTNRYGEAGGYLLVAPRQRLIVAATDKSRIMEQLPPKGFNATLDRFIEGQDGSAIFVNPRQVEVMVSDKHMPDVGWIVAAVLPTSEAFAPIRAMQQRLLLATLLLTVLAGTLTWWMLRRQLAPMLDTVQMLLSLADSNETPQALPVRRPDELGHLVDGFNRLLQTLALRESALKESSRHYRQLVTDLQVGVVIQSPSSEIVMSNQLALELLGLSEDQLLGRTSMDPGWDVIHEDGSPFPGPTHPVSQAISTLKAIENVVMGVFRPTKQNRVWLLVTAKPQFHPDGSLHQVVVTFSDISKRKQAEAALAKSEAFKNTILDSLTAEIAVVDSQGIIQAVNESWQRFLLDNSAGPGSAMPLIGVGANYLTACRSQNKAHASSSLEASTGIQAVLGGRLPHFNLEYPCDSPKQKRWFAMTVVPLGQNVRDGAVISHTDITKLKQATQDEHLRNHILELLASDQTLLTILEQLVLGVEKLQSSAYCSILLLSDDGRYLEHGIGPSLPATYNAALEGIEIGMGVGSCGTAAFTGERVVVEDISTHPYWAPYLDLARNAGLGSCWSQPILAASGQVLGTFAIYHPTPHSPEVSDIARIEQSARLASIAIEKSRWLQLLRDSEVRFRSMMEDVAGVAVQGYAMDGTITFWNRASERLYGFSAQDAIGSNLLDLIIPVEMREGVAAAMAEMATTGVAIPAGELTLQTRGGGRVQVFSNHVLVKPAMGAVEMFCLDIDLTERKEMEDQVRQLAFFDPLTKLPNRRVLDDRLKLTMASSSRTGRYGALIFLDLDNFKPLNDSHGHDAGDLLLIEVARRLTACVREMDTVVRMGGDEFVVMLGELKTERHESHTQAGVIAEKIRMALAQAYTLTVRREGLPEITVQHHCSASLGVALFVNHENSQADILKWADAAMYAAKDAGRNRVRFHAPEGTPAA
ncbi:MAG: diguanylate cyclase [Rhodoferax sp.]|uniref:sensor domain-containing diguanylate cyclase n=1 Tax=Rhodoferax sp. TaxID=50421 RepID=UPI001B5FD9B0|nr:diguanylate cyclase [Rhodoferax sp.]MBP9905246.1 diguanylate cyclase [Rhodoferax sp.]